MKQTIAEKIRTNPVTMTEDDAAELVLCFDKIAKLLTAQTIPEKFKLFQLQNPLPIGKKQKVKNSAVVKKLVAAIGLEYGKKYVDSTELNYRKIVILISQNDIGMDLKKSIFRLFNTNWPELLRLSFIEEVIVPTNAKFPNVASLLGNSQRKKFDGENAATTISRRNLNPKVTIVRMPDSSAFLDRKVTQPKRKAKPTKDNTPSAKKTRKTKPKK